MMKFSARQVYTTSTALLLAAFTPMLAGEAGAQVDVPSVDGTLEPVLDKPLPPLDDRLGGRLGEEVDERARKAEDAVTETLEERALQKTVEGVAGEATGALGQAGELVSGAAQNVTGAVSGVLRPFEADVDPLGRGIEKNVLVVLVDNDALATVAGFGLDIVAYRRMTGLGLTLVTLRGPNARSLVKAAAELRRTAPEAAVDYNHLYREASAIEGEDATDDPRRDTADDGAAKNELRIGMIDSAVAAAHPSLADSRVVPGDFVTHDGSQPTGHGTAVASLIADATANKADIYSASVFFQLPDHAPGATTESLVAALDWLAAEQVDVINMSLAGPPNALLARALEQLEPDGPVVVAAVGNNGPSGEPLYPAAYEAVIGVTAVDTGHRVFRYANRGKHVAFAALGVNVKVADTGGGWRIESGTSMASPLVATVVASVRRDDQSGREALMATLIAGAEDLGKEGFDDIFGHGLISQAPTIVSGIRTRPQP